MKQECLQDMSCNSCVLVKTSKFYVFNLHQASINNISLEQAPCPITDLTSFINQGDLQALGEYLAEKNIFDLCDSCKERPFVISEFAAAGRKHADAIELQSREGWPVEYGFRECRQTRGSAEFWRHNENASRLPGLITFVSRLPFFISTGKVTVILSEKGSVGSEHVDHRFDDFVSEFVWLRTGVGATKEFYVRDADGEKRYIKRDAEGGASSCVWFHDRHSHSIEKNVLESSYSIRIDGVFTDQWRKYLCDFGVFAQQSVQGTTWGGFREVLRAQGFETDVSPTFPHSPSSFSSSTSSNGSTHIVYKSPKLSEAAVLSLNAATAAARAVCARTAALLC